MYELRVWGVVATGCVEFIGFVKGFIAVGSWFLDRPKTKNQKLKTTFNRPLKKRSFRFRL